MGKETLERMERDLEHVRSFSGEAYITLSANVEPTTEGIGRELQRIAKTNRSAAYTAVGSYMGLKLLVKAEYSLAQIFDHNSFFVEGLDGMKYRYGMTGALPLAFTDKVQYPEMTLQRLPSIIESQKRRLPDLRTSFRFSGKSSAVHGARPMSLQSSKPSARL